MKRIAHYALGLLVLAAAGQTAAAQEDAQAPVPQAEGFFGKPAFLLMPSTLIAPVLSGVGDVDAGDTKVYFNARLMTVVPTTLEWLQFVAGAQWQPNGARSVSRTGVRGGRATQPAIFYGTITPFVPLNEATGGWLSLSFDVLGVYAAGLGGTSDTYGHDLFFEGAAVVPLGQKMFPSMSFFGNVSAFALLDQQITHPARTRSGDTDRWNPIALAGIIIPVGQ